MSTVSTRPRSSAASTARNLRQLTREHGVSTSALVWILGCSRVHAFRLRHNLTVWTCTEVFLLMREITPAPPAQIDWASVFTTEAAA